MKFLKTFFRSIFWFCLIVIVLIAGILRWGLTPITQQLLKKYIQPQWPLQINIEHIALNPFKMDFILSGLDVLDESHQKLLSLGSLEIDMKLSSLWQDEWIIEALVLEQPDIVLIRDQDGQLRLQKTLAKIQSTQQSEPSARESSNELKTIWLQHFSLRQAKIFVKDLLPQSPFELTLSPISFDLKNFKTEANALSKGQLNVALEDGGHIELQAEFMLQPLSVGIRWNIFALPLSVVQSYLSEYTRLDLRSGFFTTHGLAQLSQNKDLAFDIKLHTDVRLDQLQIYDQADQELQLAWSELYFDDLVVDLKKQHIKVEQLKVLSPHVQIVRQTNGQLQWQDFLMKADQVKQKATSSSSLSTTKKTVDQPELNDATAWQLNLNHLNIQSGTVSVLEKMVEPPFALNLSEISLDVGPITLEKDSVTEFDLALKLNDVGDLEFQGQTKPFAKPLSANFDFTLFDYPLKSLSSLVAPYVGYQIDSGTLKVTMDYNIEENLLTAEQVIETQQLTLGDKIESDKTLNLPIKFALSLLEDATKRIHLDVPVEGRLDDPEFRLQRVIGRTLSNLITKIVTSPFSILAGIAGVDNLDQLEYVRFKVGQSTLSPEQESNLQKIKTALINRPQIVLSIPTLVHPEYDKIYFQQQIFSEEWQRRRAISDVFDDTLLERWFVELFGAGELDALRLKSGLNVEEVRSRQLLEFPVPFLESSVEAMAAAEIETAKNDDVDTSYLRAMRQQIQSAQVIDDVVLQTLSDQRQAVIERVLQDLGNDRFNFLEQSKESLPRLRDQELLIKLSLKPYE